MITNFSETKKGEVRRRYVVSPLKGFSHVDFIVASSIFILVFVITITAITDFFTRAEDSAEISTLTGKSISMLSVGDYGLEPANWTGNTSLQRLGLSTRAFVFMIALNNTMPYMINQSQNISTLSTELITFNYSGLGFAADVNSTYIYDDSGNFMPYSVSNDVITFAGSAGANETRIYTIYFDDDSNFTSKSAAVSGTNAIREMVFPVQAITVMQHRQLALLNTSNYTMVRDSLNTGEFRISIYDFSSGQPVYDFGGTVPEKGNVVAMQRYLQYQNVSGSVAGGRLVVRTW